MDKRLWLEDLGGRLQLREPTALLVCVINGIIHT